eukprot:TRINITY_DN2643_c1_g3_i1.p2 TRINITY_DN2643_c1_g3~~TRINITY_DN2643_c1_g3_i1.p2  ORF type:complete len:120 (-),score=34.99 TRINITY_DN2643_c1_g3_i1:29-388(-)
MKFVDQNTGGDKDVNNVQMKKIERKRQDTDPQDDIPVEFKMVCTRCNGVGHLNTECFVDLKGTKTNYELIPESDQDKDDYIQSFKVGEVTDIKMAMRIIREFESRKKQKDKKKKKKKHK